MLTRSSHTDVFEKHSPTLFGFSFATVTSQRLKALFSFEDIIHDGKRKVRVTFNCQS